MTAPTFRARDRAAVERMLDVIGDALEQPGLVAVVARFADDAEHTSTYLYRYFDVGLHVGRTLRPRVPPPPPRRKRPKRKR